MNLLPLLTLLPITALAALNGRCSGSEATGEWGDAGICIRTGTCASYGGVYKSGACPHDPEDVKCCLIGRGPSPINICGGDSWCDWVPDGCPGAFLNGEWKTRFSRGRVVPFDLPPQAWWGLSLWSVVADVVCCRMTLGYCPGGNDFKCCYNP